MGSAEKVERRLDDPGSKTMTRHTLFASSFVAAVVLVASGIAFADSHVRIVRLSYVDGQVQMDRATGSGLERALLNTPVQEGMRIVTAGDGLAEVEFENGNTLRLAGDSEVRFSQLLVNDAGAKVNEITVSKGTVYLDTPAKGDDLYRLQADGETFVPKRGTQLRLNAGSDQIHLAVFKGDVQVAGAESLTVSKKQTLTIDPQNPSNYQLARDVQAQPSDAWDKEREAYAQTYAHNSGFGGPNYGYGLQDLNYYGDFSYVPGYGYGWQPYGFANAMLSWNPYSNGAWTFCPGVGYAFSSFYPWGWLPYHYGSWAYVGGSGWFWLPGGGYNHSSWYNGFQNVPKIVKQPAGWTPAAPPALTAASPVKPTVVVGNASVAPAYIAGGRVPPNFASVIPGHSARVSTAASFARPAVTTHSLNESGFARSNAGMAERSGRSGHVFVAPASSAGLMSGYSAAASSMGAGGFGGHAISGGHASAASAGHGGGGGHR